MKLVIIPALFLLSLSVFGQNVFPYTASLTDMEGNEISSASFSNNGHPIVIDFWGSFCKPCIVKYNAMKEVYEKWQADTGVKIIIVSIDHEKMKGASKKLIDKYDWPFEAYFDSNQELLDQLADGNSVPRTYIFDGNHKLVYEKTGASIIPKGKSTKPDSVMSVMYGGGSLESITCDLSEYKKVIYKLSKK